MDTMVEEVVAATDPFRVILSFVVSRRYALYVASLYCISLNANILVANPI